MNEFDVIIGMDSSTINKAIAQLYNRSDLRNRVFKGSVSQPIMGVTVTADYDVQQAPLVYLQSLTNAKDWQQCIKADGSAPQPTSNSFFLNFPKLKITQTTPQSQEATIYVKTICTANISGNTLTFKAVAVLIDFSGLNQNTVTMYKAMIIPKVLQMANSIVSGISLPSLNFEGISLTTPGISIQSERLIVASNLSGRALTPIGSSGWPDKPFFILCSPRMLQQLGNVAAGQAKGKNFSTSGSKGFTVGDASYSAGGTINSISVSPSPDLTVMNCRIGIGAHCSADVSIDPFKPIIKVLTPWN
ncbi:MAG: hypothetical protein GY765_20490 [bacterium]|nr:hypothetical protein [bacterium]